MARICPDQLRDEFVKALTRATVKLEEKADEVQPLGFSEPSYRTLDPAHPMIRYVSRYPHVAIGQWP